MAKSFRQPLIDEVMINDLTIQMILALLSVQLVNKEQFDIRQSLNKQVLVQTAD